MSVIGGRGRSPILAVQGIFHSWYLQREGDQHSVDWTWKSLRLACSHQVDHTSAVQRFKQGRFTISEQLMANGCSK